MIEAWVKSPPDTKVKAAFCTSVSTLLSTKYHCGRSQTAETAPAAQLNEEVKWSSTVTAQDAAFPSGQTWTLLQLYMCWYGRPSCGQSVGLRAPTIWG